MSPALERERPVVVCGAGAAGMAAAIASARQDVPTLLVEERDRTGGTAVHTLIHTLAGFYDGDGELLNGGLAAELVDRLTEADARVTQRKMGQVWVLNAPPAVYHDVTSGWLRDEAALQVSTGSRVVRAGGGGGLLEELVVRTGTDESALLPSAVVDTTGTGELARLVDPGSVEDGEERAAGGLMVRLRGVAPGTLQFPRGVGLVRDLRKAATAGRLPAACAHAWLDTGVDPDEVYLKLFVPVKGDWRAGGVLDRIETSARETAEQALGFLREQPGFAAAEVAEVGALGIRDGGRLRGEYQLTADDVRSGRTFDEPACRCAWPIEYWHPEEGIQLEPLSGCYEIPLDALRLRGWRNVWMAGKCLSADHLAQASARVIGTCWAMGDAAGRAAATFASETLARS